MSSGINATVMPPQAVDLLTPRILVVDDERQIHSAIKLRIGTEYELICCLNGPEALEKISRERFDLCLTDIHMPKMDGLTFIDRARQIDAELGFVLISAFDTDENLRRAIPLQVYDFLSKPLPDRAGFEARIPEWIQKTRQRRSDHDLARHAGTLTSACETARLEREVELVASETARDALLQAAGLLTTIHAHLVNANGQLAARARTDSTIIHLLRGIEEAKKTADAAMTVTETFFGSAYGSRESSPAVFNESACHAIAIAARMTRAHELNKMVDLTPLDHSPQIRGLSGIEFLLTLVPAIATVLAGTPPKTTVRVTAEHVSRLSLVPKDSRLGGCVWLNRKRALISQPALLILISSAAPPFARLQIEAWLAGDFEPLASMSAQGLLAGLRKSHGLMGISIAPDSIATNLALALPV